MLKWQSELSLKNLFDFKSASLPFKYGYPHVKLIELYNFVAIESIRDVIHIIPRFGKSNEYFVNKIYIIAIRKPVKTCIYNAHLFFHLFFSSCIYNNASIPFFSSYLLYRNSYI